MDMARHLWTDQPIMGEDEDWLNFADYADVLAEVILSADTPITVGIFGPWGSGKTSLMRLIAERLAGRRTAAHRRAHGVWFNAWQYERDEAALWRALLLHVLEGLREGDVSEEDAQQIEDWRMRLYADVDRTEFGSLQIDWPAAGKAALKLGLSFVPGPSTLANLAQLVRGDLETFEDLTTAFRRERVEIQRRRLSLLEEFHASFAHLVREYIRARNGLLVVFVDDLDRCMPRRAVEVLETIKLYLDAPGCAFVIAADRDVIERVVQAQYGGQASGTEAGGMVEGRSYLEKLVQLPFHLPPLEEDQIVSFIATCAPWLEPACGEVFALGLEPNPRMVKRALNIFHLLSSLARRRAQAGAMEPVVPGLLTKMVVIQTRYHDLYRDLQEYPNLIQDLEMAAREGTEVRRPVPPMVEVAAEAETLLEQYLRRKPLLRMLRVGPAFAGLSQEQIGAYIYLTRTTGAEGAATISDAPARRWVDLLSNDSTRLRAAVAAIQKDGTAQWYVEPLARLLEPGSEASPSERLSAAAALALLGDPRDFDQMVEIPGGSFPYGQTCEPVMVMTFRIARYPLTNAQYAGFLAANPHFPVPFLDEEWARPYNWDRQARTWPEGRATHPVVLVSWEDATAYCAWAGLRLPTEEEWEKAARGEDGRVYPWGADFDPARANVRESGVGGTTPVGAYPEGQSPSGLLDCAGNVWEWTSTLHDRDEVILRGGSWNFHASDARTFSRERAHRSYRSNRIGFRVAAGPLPRSGDRPQGQQALPLREDET